MIESLTHTKDNKSGHLGLWFINLYPSIKQNKTKYTQVPQCHVSAVAPLFSFIAHIFFSEVSLSEFPDNTRHVDIVFV